MRPHGSIVAKEGASEAICDISDRAGRARGWSDERWGSEWWRDSGYVSGEFCAVVGCVLVSAGGHDAHRLGDIEVDHDGEDRGR